ncbi:unnamed protein product [Prunus armeniaca]|uniref:Uncharacterized protein n=1 Tax=Prunus armeniaca TaxID=36596 RepID=A0A6J5WA80_PRUAR|nr:unnamed protein product [Prunus armeniaca]
MVIKEKSTVQSIGGRFDGIAIGVSAISSASGCIVLVGLCRSEACRYYDADGVAWGYQESLELGMAAIGSFPNRRLVGLVV